MAHNVRGQIVCRYVSLLRYLASWRNPETGRGYDRIVILAHSQGTVITADVLKLLNDEELARANGLEAFLPREDGSGPKCPIRVFSMGSPLRQIYAQRFPATYGWACPELNGEGIRTADFLGVELWWNAYRSGDYVGRYLWRTLKGDDPEPSFVPYAHDVLRSEFSPVGRVDFPAIREYCLSPGAHTQYWNETAPEVMVDLDSLVGTLSRPQDAALQEPYPPVQPSSPPLES